MINTMPLFHIINGGILLYFLFYLIKKYLVPALIKQKKEGAVTLERLEQEYLKAQEELQHLQQRIKSQKIVYTHLEQHIAQWKLKIEEERTQQIIINHAIQEKLQEKRLIQQKGFNQERHYNTVIPQVVAYAREELEKKAAHEEGKQYIKKIIAGLQ